MAKDKSKDAAMKVKAGPIVWWRDIRRPSFINYPELATFPVLGTGESGYVLLQKIQSMPPGKPISFRDAWIFAFEEIWKRMREENGAGPDNDPSTASYILSDIVRHLVEQGYQVRLDGTEFEILDTEESKERPT